MTAAKPNADAKSWNQLGIALADRRRQLVAELRAKVRVARTGGPKERDAGEGDSAEADLQEDIEIALMEIQAETLERIEVALRRVAEGTYGECSECGAAISEARLRAIPFAVRCRDCEEARETTERRERIVAQRRGSSMLASGLSRKMSEDSS